MYEFVAWVMVSLFLLAILAGILAELVELARNKRDKKNLKIKTKMSMPALPEEKRLQARELVAPFLTAGQDWTSSCSNYKCTYIPQTATALADFAEWTRLEVQKAFKLRFTLVTDIYHVRSLSNSKKNKRSKKMVEVPAPASNAHVLVVIPLDPSGDYYTLSPSTSSTTSKAQEERQENEDKKDKIDEKENEKNLVVLSPKSMLIQLRTRSKNLDQKQKNLQVSGPEFLLVFLRNFKSWDVA